MEDVLAIFPSRGLDNSILVPIYIGLLIHAFFIESMGWSYAGLVVSGYLASVFAIAPQAGMVIGLEICTTYLIVYVISEVFARSGWWHSFFGRERFLFFFIISLLVRLIYEVWLFHSVTEWVVDYFGMPLEAASHLYGIGLVIVPLSAHAMWRPGFRRGFVQVGVPVLLTLLVLKYLLIPYTNFSIANFELTFQDLALDFTSSPKIYITLILGLLIAARFNLRYGWDFNGIMIPSLLAVSWYMPWKVLATIVESTLVAAIAFMVASLPFFRRSNLQGIRRLLLIFTIGLSLKFVIGFYLTETNPGFRASDLFGFGYLLPSLIALNMWDNRSWSLVVGPTIFTSLVAFVAGNVVGLALFKVDELFIEEVVPSAEKQVLQVAVLDIPLESLELAAVQTRPILPEDFQATSPAARIRYQNILAAAKKLASESDPLEKKTSITSKFARNLQKLNLSLSRTEFKDGEGNIKSAFVLRESLESTPGELRGWPTVVLVIGCSEGMLLDIPYPYEESAAWDAALKLFPDMNACAMISNGWRSFQLEEKAVLRRAGSPFSLAHKIISEGAVAQIRVAEGPSTIYVRTRLPSEFKLKVIKRLFPDYRMIWHQYDEYAPIRGSDLTDSVEIVLNRDDINNLRPGLPRSEEELSISGIAYLRGLLTENPEWIAPPLSERYRTPMPFEMEYFQEMLVRPIRRSLEFGRPELDELEALRSRLSWRAKALGYEILAFGRDPQGRVEWLLKEIRPERGWGLYLFRSGARQWTLEAPRPLQESRTLEIAMDAYGRLQASALYIAGADLQARRDGSSDITRLDNVVNPFQAAHRAAYPSESGLPLPWILQVRGMSVIHSISSDALLSLAVDMPIESPRLPAAKELENDLKELDWAYELYDGRLSQIGLKGVDNLQMRYSAALSPQNSAMIWVSGSKRQSLVSMESQKKKSEQLKRFDLLSRKAYLEDVLSASLLKNGEIDKSFAETLSWLRKYSEGGNVSFLDAATEQAGPGKLRMSTVKDSLSGKIYILLEDAGSSTRCVVRVERGGSKLYSLDRDSAEKAINQIRFGNGLGLCTSEVLP